MVFVLHTGDNPDSSCFASVCFCLFSFIDGGLDVKVRLLSDC